MEFLLAFLLWISAGAGPQEQIAPDPQTESVQTLVTPRNFKRVERINTRRAIIVLDDTQFRPGKQ